MADEGNEKVSKRDDHKSDDHKGEEIENVDMLSPESDSTQFSRGSTNIAFRKSIGRLSLHSSSSSARSSAARESSEERRRRRRRQKRDRQRAELRHKDRLEEDRKARNRRWIEACQREANSNKSYVTLEGEVAYKISFRCFRLIALNP